MMLEGRALDVFRISIEVASAATLLLLVPALLLAFTLARRDFPGKALVETVVALPLVLPPTAIGYLILRLVARDGPLGERALGFDPDLLLTWKGAVLSAALMSLPIVVRTARVAFEEVSPRVELMGRSLGYSASRTFARVTLPLARRGLLAAVALGFGRALGEFGATVVVAGNVRGRTQTLSLAIFEDIQLGRNDSAMHLVAISTVMAFALVYAFERLQRRPR
jgi:molybdate transport system permease protein